MWRFRGSPLCSPVSSVVSLLSRRPEAHLHFRFVGIFHLEHGLWPRIHESCDERVGHLLDADIESVHGIVVELPRSAISLSSSVIRFCSLRKFSFAFSCG